MTGAPDGPGPGGVPASIAAIMASIRREVTAPPRAPDVLDEVPGHDGAAAVPPRAGLDAPRGTPQTPVDSTASPPRCAPLPSLDDETRTLLAPLLRDWLDTHLPEIVETAVHAEIRRLTGLGD